MKPIKTGLVFSGTMVLLAASVLAVLTTTAQAQIYKWVDDKGVTNYSGTPPKGASPGISQRGTGPQPKMIQSFVTRRREGREGKVRSCPTSRLRAFA